MPFDPSTIAGLQAWYDADSLTGADGSAVNTFTDRQGSFNATLASGTAPALRYASQNGLKTVEFGGGANQLSISSALLNGATQGCFFAVFRLVNDPPTFGSFAGAVLDGFTNDTSGNKSSHHPYTDGVFYEHFGLTVRQTTGNPAPSFTLHRIYNVEVSGAAGAAVMRQRIDALQTFQATGQTVNFGNVTRRLGSNAAPAYLAGWIAEILVYNAVPVQADREKIEGYLAWKWGLQANLPAGHPYKSAAPGTSAGVTGTASIAVSPFTSASAAKVRSKANAAPALAAFTGAATAKVRAKASAAVALSPFVSAAAAKARVHGLGGGTLNAFGSTATAKVRIKAAASMSPAPFTATATGHTVSLGAITGAASIALSPFISAAAAKVRVEGVGSGTLNPFTAAASAKARVRGTAGASLGAFTGSGGGRVRIAGAASISWGPLTATAVAGTPTEHPTVTTPADRRSAGEAASRSLVGDATSRRVAGNLQPRRAAA